MLDTILESRSLEHEEILLDDEDLRLSCVNTIVNNIYNKIKQCSYRDYLITKVLCRASEDEIMKWAIDFNDFVLDNGIHSWFLKSNKCLDLFKMCR